MKHHFNPEKNSRIALRSRLSRWLGNGFVAIAASGWIAATLSADSQCLEGCDISPVNTYLGEDALLTHGGSANTAVGFFAQYQNDGASDTAIGETVLRTNLTGSNNTGTGAEALFLNTDKSDNTADGFQALENNTGHDNTATGASAMLNNKGGSNNVANGSNALLNNKGADFNTADGTGSLKANVSGTDNTAEGYQALLNSTGSSNIALGSQAGLNLTTGSNNIDIGADGMAGESNTMRLGKKGTQKNTYINGVSGVTVAGGVQVIIGTGAHLGTIVSSKRFKDNIHPMDKTSEAILSLRPVTFRYKKELDPQAIPQFGLVAEQVEKIDPNLVARDDQGQPYSVRYEAVNAMLLNEFLKEHQKVASLEATIARQDQSIDNLASQIETLATQLALPKASTRIATNR